MIFISKA